MQIAEHAPAEMNAWPGVVSRLSGAPLPTRRPDSSSSTAPLSFELHPGLEAHEPPEARGLARDEVRLMVSHRAADRIDHARFRDLPDPLEPGDLVVINTSGTLNAALPARRADGTPLELHLSTGFPTGLWVVEVRRIDGASTKPFYRADPGEMLALPGGGRVTLHVPYRILPNTGPHLDREAWTGLGTGASAHVRLWVATLELPLPVPAYLAAHGAPIRYGYVTRAWPSTAYQTVYATEPGSAEMPSAGRPFTPEIITRLVARGIHVAPLVLHTGVASLEDHEPPYEEYYRVPEATARLVNATRAAGRRVVAVGTTVVRALETVTDDRGTTQAGEGWTRLVITPARGLRAVNALLTGLHEPRATHLAMLEALVGIDHLRHTYDEALRERYLWHEFGDAHLLLP
jgi:S-adenosylmethionine:tRNA ribosyltransferase-isomerase